MPLLDSQVLQKLRTVDTPTICNVIELFDVRPRNQGYMDARIRACFPELPPPYLRTGSARIALELMLQSGGSAYLPQTMVNHLLADTSLMLIKDAPVMTRELFAISLPKSSQRQQISDIVTQLRHILAQSK